MTISMEEIRKTITERGLDCVSDVEGLELLARLERAEKERDALRARIEAMERQEPVGRALLCVRCSTPFDGEHYCPACGHHTATEEAVYALPGAQPSPSFADAYQGAMEDVAIWKKRALEAEDLNRKFVAEINGPAYTCEPAQPAASVPVEAIGKMLADAMTVAVSNGANSVSMPDEYVEVAVWLRGISPQPTPSVPEGWQLAPIDPAQEMLRAGNRWANGLAYETYKAMITVAPEAES